MTTKSNVTRMPDPLSNDLASLRIARQEENPEAKARTRNRLIAVAAVAGVMAIAAAVTARVSASIYKREVAVTEIRLVSPAESSIEVTSTGYVVPQLRSKVGA